MAAVCIDPVVGSVIQRAAPLLAAGAGAAIVSHQRRSLVSPTSVTFPRQRLGGRMRQQLSAVHVEPRGVQIFPLSAASTTLSSGELGDLSHISLLCKSRHSLPLPRASKDVHYDSSYPAIIKKVKWPWRTLACIPYLVTMWCHMMSSFTENPLHPFLKAIRFPDDWFYILPAWIPLAYYIVVGLGVLMREEGPHFLRFHVIMGWHLDAVGLIIRYVMPFAVHRCKVNKHFWTAIAFAYFLIVLESTRRAIAGMYPHIPYSSDEVSSLLNSDE